MSLCYSDQHLAWQQRIKREMSAAAQHFQMKDMRQRFVVVGRYRRRKTKRKVASSSNSMCKLPPPAPDLRAYNVYAEVRGKYARPVSRMTQTPLPAELPPMPVSIVSRPSTVIKYKKTRSFSLCKPTLQHQEEHPSKILKPFDYSKNRKQSVNACEDLQTSAKKEDRYVNVTHEINGNLPSRTHNIQSTKRAH